MLQTNKKNLNKGNSTTEQGRKVVLRSFTIAICFAKTGQQIIKIQKKNHTKGNHSKNISNKWLCVIYILLKVFNHCTKIHEG